MRWHEMMTEDIDRSRAMSPFAKLLCPCYLSGTGRIACRDLASSCYYYALLIQHTATTGVVFSVTRWQSLIRQPHCVHCTPGSPYPAHITSSQSPPSFSPSVTPSTDLKLISFTNPFLHSHSYSFQTDFTDLNLYQRGTGVVCFSFFFWLRVLDKAEQSAFESTLNCSIVSYRTYC